MKPAIMSFVVAILASTAIAAEPDAGKPKELIAAMGKALASMRQFSFTAHTTFDTALENGQKIQLARSQKVLVKRPDTIRSTIVGDDLHVQFLYDGKAALFYNVDKKSFAKVDAPATIDQTLDMLAQDYGLPMQLADFLFADPAKALTEDSRESRYVGKGRVMDEECDHLAFRQDSVDWQVWISRDGKSLPRKLVITYREVPGSPQFTAYLSNLSTDVGDAASQLRLDIPSDAKQVELVRRPPATAPAAGK